MPSQSEILSAKYQESSNSICLWVLVYPENYNNMESRYIEVYGTGHEIINDMEIERKFIDTVQINDLVFHVFERIN